ncbi:ROK family protein [Pedobacter arcticus]|uniref:ROK family protein n=1 Tax=Pedobacter arcticus TaxID=752140 RepID=UPI00030947E4|nr:ROK family protein [Pedobacter arcticus]
MKINLVLGVDISASHIKVALVDLETKKIMDDSYVRQPINSWGNADEIINSWTSIILSAFDKQKIAEKYIRIAMPGPFDYANGVSLMLGQKKYDSLYGLSVKQLLAKKLNIPSENIRFLNDSTCFLNGELSYSDGFRNQTVIALNIGTGLASAVYKNGISVDAQLWNSSFLDYTAEDYISSGWFLKEYVKLTGINIINIKGLRRIYSKSPVARELFKAFSVNLANFIYEFVLREEPDYIILGGEVLDAYPCFKTDLGKNLIKKNINVPLILSKADPYSSVLGAALSGGN